MRNRPTWLTGRFIRTLRRRRGRVPASHSGDPPKGRGPSRGRLLGLSPTESVASASAAASEPSLTRPPWCQRAAVWRAQAPVSRAAGTEDRELDCLVLFLHRLIPILKRGPCSGSRETSERESPSHSGIRG